MSIGATSGLTAWRRDVARIARVPERLVAAMPVALISWRAAGLATVPPVDELLAGALDGLAAAPVDEPGRVALATGGTVRTRQPVTQTRQRGRWRAGAAVGRDAATPAAVRRPDGALAGDDGPPVGQALTVAAVAGPTVRSSAVEIASATFEQPHRQPRRAASRLAGREPGGPSQLAPREVDAFAADLRAAPRRAPVAANCEPSEPRSAPTAHGSGTTAGGRTPAATVRSPIRLQEPPADSPTAPAPSPTDTFGSPPASPTGLAGLVSWWQERQRVDNDTLVDHSVTDHQPAVRRHPGGAPVGDAVLDAWPAASSPDVDPGLLGPLQQFRDALEQVLLDEALADGLRLP
jgi:hypothetical protein